ncbi:unnamed protein product [Notodromas monacha]|uniref:Uncharacterized protein n=1 Tax=Notodromas monacha TaxID=399045 RepID=A0A7R9BTD1_9CRUS|nr:unnamed protein product [Notodromas monacha]CAG0920340.1 unnamed protein product [Notodromas monacha]
MTRVPKMLIAFATILIALADSLEDDARVSDRYIRVSHESVILLCCHYWFGIASNKTPNGVYCQTEQDAPLGSRIIFELAPSGVSTRMLNRKWLSPDFTASGFFLLAHSESMLLSSFSRAIRLLCKETQGGLGKGRLTLSEAEFKACSATEKKHTDENEGERYSRTVVQAHENPHYTLNSSKRSRATENHGTSGRFRAFFFRRVSLYFPPLYSLSSRILPSIRPAVDDKLKKKKEREKKEPPAREEPLRRAPSVGASQPTTA